MKKLIKLLTSSIFALFLVSNVMVAGLVAVAQEDFNALPSRGWGSAIEEEEFVESNLLPLWAIEMMSTYSQNNEVLDIAFEDYLQIEDKFMFSDLDTFVLGSTYSEVLNGFVYNFGDVEVFEDRYDNGVSLISYIYRADEGDINPETTIEDWANIDFYFVDDYLVFSGLSSMSLNFQSQRSAPREEVANLFDTGQVVDTLFDVDNLEIYGLGQIMVSDEFVYVVGFPITPPEAGGISEGGMVVVMNDTLYTGMTVTFNELLQYSFTGYYYLTLVNNVPNQLYQVQ